MNYFSTLLRLLDAANKDIVALLPWGILENYKIARIALCIFEIRWYKFNFQDDMIEVIFLYINHVVT